MAEARAQDWPAGVGREIHAELDSTNAEALRRGGAGAPVWILAERQTAGRGRRGRAWRAPEGHFAATLLMRPPGPPAQAALRSFVAALALREALVGVTGRSELFAMKWPNDVLLSGRKLAGILLESGTAPDGGPVLAVGIGVNLGAAPEAAELEPGAVAPAGLAAETGLRIAPADFLDLLAPAFARWEALLMAEGFEPLRRAWLGGAARLGEEMVARLPGRQVAGRFETVDATGALVIATATGREVLPAAEVHFGAAVPGEGSHAAGH
jgi:BirA family transcriptional regulator, biotin operon repressor / biotin---[acetyl-CoA-carboxylase] ligase